MNQHETSKMTPIFFAQLLSRFTVSAAQCPRNEYNR